MGNSHSCPMNDPQVVKERKEAQAKIDELQRKIDADQEARNEQLRKFYETSLQREREHGNERVKAAMDMKEVTEKMTEKLNEQQIKNTEKLLELMCENDKVMAKGIEHMEKFPLYASAEEECKMLAELLENIRRNLSESHKISSDLYEMIAKESPDGIVKEKINDLKKTICDEGRLGRNGALTQLGNSRNMDNKLRATTTAALISLNKVSDVLYRQLPSLQYAKSPTALCDIDQIDGIISKMQDIFDGIPHMQGQSIAHRTMETMEQIHEDKRKILNGLATASRVVDDPTTAPPAASKEHNE